jgi:myo-inositol-1(or 4)-monophosphatase
VTSEPVHAELQAACEVAVALAREAGALQLRERRGVTVRATKAHRNDLVSDVDLASEALIVDGLGAAFPDDGVLGEEGESTAGVSGRRWVVDPLDGTRNYLSAAGPWSVCIALQQAGPDGAEADLVLGVVHDPALGETFSAVAGGGCLLDGRPVRASSCERLDEALAGLSFDPSVASKERMAPAIAALLPVVGDIRRIPAALHLAYLASGRLDCGLLIGAKLWDVAAGLVLAREAGVVLGGAGGTPAPELVVAAAPGVWREYTAGAAVQQLTAR